MYDAADSILAQKIAQVQGVGQVNVGGGAKPAVRVELNPRMLNSIGIGTDQIRAALQRRKRPHVRRVPSATPWTCGNSRPPTSFQRRSVRKLIVAYQNGAAVRLGDVATVIDSVEDRRNAGLSNGKPAVLVIISRQPAANMIDTVDRLYTHAARTAGVHPAGDQDHRGDGPHHHHPRSHSRRAIHVDGVHWRW